MISFYKKQYTSAKLILNVRADAEYPGCIFKLNELRELSRTFEEEYCTGKLLFYKGIPYRWDDKIKEYFMITYYPEYIACMEYIGLPVNVKKSLRAINKWNLKRIILPSNKVKNANEFYIKK